MTALSSKESLEWHISGMDCAACARKIQTAVERLPGVSGVEITLMNERLRLILAPDITAADQVERAVQSLGYGIAAPTPASQDQHGHDHAPHSPTKQTEPRWYQTAKARLVFFTGILLAASQIATWTVLADHAVWAFALACLVGLLPVARKALAALRAGMPFTIEMLMTIAATGALFIGEAQEAALVVFLFAVGELLEGVATNMARDGIRALAKLVPATALLEHDGHSHEVAAETLRPGQIIQVRPGDRLAVDGEIVTGTSGIDESAVTGESIPVTKGPGATVLAGTINTEAVLRVRVMKASADSTLARIAQMVADAEAARAPTERFIDRFSRWYMPAIVGVAVLLALLPPLAMGADWGTWTYRALALLLIGCPCALVISVPAAIAAALSTGARHGLLIKGGAVIEAMANLHTVALDKTGTLTEGRPVLTDTLPADGTPAATLLQLAATVEAGSTHPLAKAILAQAKADGLTLLANSDARAHPGKGVEARIDGALVQVRVADAVVPAVAQLQSEGKTVVQVTRDGVSLGLLALRDEPRAEAAEALAQLAGLGLETVMLTGDNLGSATVAANRLGIRAQAGLLPEGKIVAIQKLAAEGGVMMVGDGINDAPALRQASVGVAMGAGTDVALETADAAILRNKLTDLPAMIRLSRAAMANIRQNVAVALGLKAVFLVTSVLGLTGLWIAVLADTGATVLVTLNAMRLLARDPRKAG
ncbi:MAG: heavy metal translocating P-type ATPase [Cypionkella sp.]|uniref:heavy metal translocating P-type ATPase n=1 Tax=Cypionkella sp. TaxID=2811411 RepID=UPI002ABB6E33|nr:heavy metal translocating P-type ATPase [Cypionkella sp.]MDZ4311764.1 heavy metal translocating P-type ATPase [Cypionkella sp.]